MNADSTVVRRLRGYWKLEACNAAGLPLVVLWIGRDDGGDVATALVLAVLACTFLLVVGALALRMMFRKAIGAAGATAVLPVLMGMRWPALFLCILAAIAVGFDWVWGDPDFSIQFILTHLVLLLAVLEYINYYHFQIQHFDHLADWRRLLSGRGFRRSHLARAIDRLQRTRRGGGAGSG